MQESLNSNTNDFKQCLGCSECLPLTSYYTKGKNRLDPRCKACMGKKNAERYKKIKIVKKRKMSVGKCEIKLIAVIKKYNWEKLDESKNKNRLGHD